MLKTKKWFVIAASIMVFALLFTACTTDSSEPVDETMEEVVEETGTIILRVGTGDSGEGLNTHQEIIARFEAENPDILVQLEAVAGNDYYTRLLTQVSADNAPDIMQIGDDAVPMFVDAGALISLDDFIANDDSFDTEMYLPGLLEPGRYMDQQYMLPKDFSPMGVYYNKMIFDEYGVDYPTDDWTWEEFLDIAQQLTMDTDGDGNTDLWGVQLTANWTTGFEYFIFANGGQLISEDGKNFLGVMDSDASVGAVQFFSDLYNVHKVAPPPADFSQWAGGNSEFDNGQAAMRLFGRWPQDGYLNNPNIELGTVMPPAGVEQANILFWGGFGISSTSEHPEAAWRFLKFYAGLEGSEVWVERAIPPVASVAEGAGLAEDPIESTWIKGLDHLVDRTYVFTPYWGATGDAALRTVLETVLTDPNADIAQLMADAAVQAQTALDEKLAEE